MAPEMISEMTIQLENKPGRLRQVVTALGEEKVNIAAVTVAEHRDRAVLRLVTDNMRATRQVLNRLNIPAKEDEVLQVPMRNRPGALAEVCEKLASEHIEIVYAYSNAASVAGRSVGIFKVSNPARALKLLSESNGAAKRNGFAKMGRKGRNRKSNPDEE